MTYQLPSDDCDHRDLQDRREGHEESGQVDSVQAVLHGGEVGEK